MALQLARTARTAAFAARALATAPSKVEKVTVVGSGLMGSGIVQVAAASQHKVTMVDVNDTVLNKAVDRIANSLSRVASRKFKDDEAAAKAFIESTMANISTNTKPEDAVSDVQLVIEAIPEDLAMKHDLFKRLDAVAPESTVFASNTSSLRIGQIAEVTNREDRFGGLHFFNPVPVMKLVEVIATDKTSPETTALLRSFGESVGKTVVSCKDTPGFIVNRLLIPYLLEAARMVERGDATVEDVDIAMKLGAGHPMGPFTLLDYVGLDTTSFITNGWARDYPDEPLFHPVGVLEEKVKEGKFGNKSGEGFFVHRK